MSKSLARVAGVGMTPFATPRTAAPYTELAAQAGRQALADAGVSYADVQQVYVSYVYGDSTSGQRAAYQLGLTGVPVINVNNNCASGSTALFLARQAIESGAADCVLALGFEQMRAGAIAELWADRPSPLEPFVAVADRRQGPSGASGPLREDATADEVAQMAHIVGEALDRGLSASRSTAWRCTRGRTGARSPAPSTPARTSHR